ncbi:hypothetical protein [Methanobrevibacter sp.]|uniref:hypothetical protein n=1 Tax=Methanobrevibacter sp. TaxID=66852 RepID=UPI003863FC33
MQLTIEKLKEEAAFFCKHESNITHNKLVGITDGKAIGTYIEKKFENYLKDKYEVTIGSSGKGIDLPDSNINTDIKVTSIKKPQSSSPFKNIEQKIYGLGYNLLIFVYEKNDFENKCYIDFKHCIFIESEKSGDYNLTKILRKMIELGADESDIIEILNDKNVPGDTQILNNLAKKILSNPPKQGYLTISNAFQWRLKYNNILNLEQEIDGVYNYKKYNEEKFGDYQTPLFFTDKICEYLKNNLKITPDIIIEPTCGTGNFLKSSSKFFPEKPLYGIEIDSSKLDQVDTTIPNLILKNEDIITFKFDNINKNNSFLIIGNPSWITEDNISKINSKSNFDIAKNNHFDITESIISKMINIFKNTQSTIAFICQTNTSRNVFIKMIKTNVPYSFIKQINFDSLEIFNINADTCLFILQFGGKPLTNKTCDVSNFSNPEKVLYAFGFISDKFYSNVDNIHQIEGKCQMEWRQGVKHDCAKIMELSYKDNKLTNKNNEEVIIENTLVYPLLKSGDLKKPIIKDSSKYVIITQKKIKQDTTYIKKEAPKTWNYLNRNKEHFDKRKSVIYKNTPQFSIYGIGDYSFKKYKVAISGFCKNPVFSLVYSEKTFMLDDGCYYLSFNDYDYAYITMLILNSKLVKKFLENIAFLDAKRPYAKNTLKRIDIGKCLNLFTLNDLKETEKELGLKEYITIEKFMKYENNYWKME